MHGLKKSSEKQSGEYAGPVAAAFFVALAGIWHYLGTVAGAEGSGDLWLKERYLLLAAGVAVSVAIVGLLLFKEIAVPRAWRRGGRAEKTGQAGADVSKNPAKRRKLPLEFCSLASVLLFGSLYLAVLAPLSAPDEISHFMSAYQVSNHLMGVEATDQEGYIMIRKEDDFLQNIYGASGDEERISLGRVLDEEAYRLIEERQSPLFTGRAADRKEMMPSVYRSVNTTPVAYLAPALGITFARLLGLNCIGLAFAGRLFNLVFFAAMCFLAVRFLPLGKYILMGVSLLPMTLHLAASYSYDAFLMGMCFFFASYCMYLAYQKPVVQRRDIVLLAVLAASFGPCKIVYAVFMGFALLIPVKKFGNKKRWFFSALAVFGAFVLAMAAVNGQAVTDYTTGAGNFVTWAGEEGFTIPLLLHNPVLFLRMLYETVLHQADEWFLSMMGSSLGNLDPVLSTPFVAVAAMTACLLALSTRKAGEALYLTGVQKGWILFLAAACLFGLMTAMLTSWTPLSSSVILGVQGRYLIPALPFVLMTMKSDRLVRTSGKDERLLFYMCLMDGYVLLRLFSIVSMRL